MIFSVFLITHDMTTNASKARLHRSSSSATMREAQRREEKNLQQNEYFLPVKNGVREK